MKRQERHVVTKLHIVQAKLLNYVQFRPPPPQKKKHTHTHTFELREITKTSLRTRKMKNFQNYPQRTKEHQKLPNCLQMKKISFNRSRKAKVTQKIQRAQECQENSPMSQKPPRNLPNKSQNHQENSSVSQEIHKLQETLECLENTSSEFFTKLMSILPSSQGNIKLCACMGHNYRLVPSSDMFPKMGLPSLLSNRAPSPFPRWAWPKFAA